MEISFCELRSKEVVNIYDGRSLGHIIDIVIDTRCARVMGIVVPKDRSFFNIFKSSSDFFIPYNRICRIGKDIILVELSYAKSHMGGLAGILDQKTGTKEKGGYNNNICVSEEINAGNFDDYIASSSQSFNKSSSKSGREYK